MKHYFYITMALILAACNTIPQDQQTIEIGGVSSDASALLIEFTGVGCVNCSSAAEEATRLLNTYSDNLVVVAMHPESNPFTHAQEQYDYTCDEADEYYRHFGGVADTPFPTGVINMAPTDGSYFVDYALWGKNIIAALKNKPAATISLNTVTDATTRQVKITADIATNTDANLILWLVENNVTGAQMMPDGSVNLQYTHNHILRESLTSLWGEKIKNGTIERQFTIDDDYQLDNCAIVAVLVNSDQQVIAVSQAELKPVTSTPLILSIDNIGDIERDTTIVITEIETNPITGKRQMGVTGVLAYNGTLYVDIHRQDTTILDQFCCGSRCINTNNQLEQQLDFSINGISSWFTHLDPEKEGDYTITYIFNSQSLNPIKLTLIYKYK